MRAQLPMLCLALTPCDGTTLRPPDGSISGALHRGMTEQQTCGAETAMPFPCKVYVYEEGPRAGRHDPKLSVVFEDVGGHWIATQWL